METRQSNLYISEAARTRVFSGGQPVPAERTLYQMEDCIQHVLAFHVRQGVTVRVEKMVTFYTSRDRRPATRSSRRPRRPPATPIWPRRSSATPRHGRNCGGCVTCAVQVCSRHTADLDAGLPARGLNGEAYRGHVFWDEIHALPFFNGRLPEVTRRLLMYRYRRIGEARAAARATGLRGAMFPWQNGSEELRKPSVSASTRSRAAGSRTSAGTSGTSTRPGPVADRRALPSSGHRTEKLR